MPETTRGASSISPDSGSSAEGRPRRPPVRRGPPPMPPEAFSSTMVFHSPQASHLPCQRV